MGDPPIVRRQRYAKQKAKEYCERDGATICVSDNDIICLIANYRTHERKIKVVIDEITEWDIRQLSKIHIFPTQSREIWCRLYKIPTELKVSLLDDGKTIKILYDPRNPSNKHTTLKAEKFLSQYFGGKNVTQKRA